ncbi:antibiotic biosynthesis monooxygenase [Kocuria sp.]|uniref:antibiotic biosynthesis monooxygenase family protein n=1 Tax=Kocuria sp. TaxID=1871328 RepID=UPI0026DBBF23|nr:antibiotic biosynthesis monooxygenase [Kocuria sp.]MDO4918794.1 antibiotic biosynthesis monooxygenase [Kocuria sp.]
MSIVKINALHVLEGHGEELAQRFAGRSGLVETRPGFEGFQVLRPNDGRGTWLVVTRWTDEASYDGWYSQRPRRDPSTVTYSDGWELWSFDLVEDVAPAGS